MAKFKVRADLHDVEVDVKQVIDDEMTEETKRDLIFDLFDGLPANDKAEILGELFSVMEDEQQKEALNDIISDNLSDEQFHTLTEYFKNYGK